MTDEDVAVRLEGYGKEIKSLKHRMEQSEKRDESLVLITGSVKELAVNMSYMADEQKKQGLRLESLEKAPADNFNYYKRIIIGCLITGAVGTVLGSIFTLILK